MFYPHLSCISSVIVGELVRTLTSPHILPWLLEYTPSEYMLLIGTWTSEKPTKSHEAIVSDRRGQKYIKMFAIHENALMRSAIDHDIGSILPIESSGPRSMCRR